jgi:undecaprenyl-diphosphatase
MNACAVAVLLCRHIPAASPIAALFALSVGASRVALGLHYASDVAAGAALGGALALALAAG